ncbi:Uncharacterised protein [Mycobacteroides abscessus subsp. abscessus]|nr:Uncharacterised protein [Mycobacteroides abscessus subsp. abscessus]
MVDDVELIELSDEGFDGVPVGRVGQLLALGGGDDVGAGDGVELEGLGGAGEMLVENLVGAFRRQ